MTPSITINNTIVEPNSVNWFAVFSLFMGVTSLITSEFIPICLLTPIAQELHVSEGVAGQTITAVGILAVITSIFISPLTKSINRKLVLISFSILLIISNITIAFAPNYLVMLLARGILGICVGGFWSMATAITLQLAPAKDIARALAIVYAGVSVATIIALPISSYLDNLIGWRNVFLVVALIGFLALVNQVLALPHLVPQPDNNFQGMISLLKTSWVSVGILATIFSYSGYHLFFSYLRPFLQVDLKLTPANLTITLLIFGLANCLGTYLAGYLMSHLFKSIMLSVHLLLAFTAFMLLLCDNKEVIENIVLIISWGSLFGFIPVGWSTWISKTLPNKAELIGGLSVASIQFSISMAAAMGGMLLNYWGINYIFVAASGVLLLACLLIMMSFSIYKKMAGISL